jgi:hypothetical protein
MRGLFGVSISELPWIMTIFGWSYIGVLFARFRFLYGCEEKAGAGRRREWGCILMDTPSGNPLR